MLRLSAKDRSLGFHVVVASVVATGLGGLARWGSAEAADGGRGLASLAIHLRAPDREAQWIGGAVMAAVLFGSVLGLLIGWDRRAAARGATAEVLRAGRRASLALGLGAFTFLAVTVYAGVVHDYYFFTQMWDEILKGHDPWFLVFGVFGANGSGDYPFNSYGPLFNPLAILYRLDVLAPKLLFAYAYVLFAAAAVKGLVERRRPGAVATLGLVAWFANPYPWVEVAIRGHFDILVALTCVAAVDARSRGRDVASGVWLAVGVLIKYIPAVLLPFLALNPERGTGRLGTRLRLRPRVIVATATVLAAGFALACAVWGPSVFRPLTFASQRGPTVLSIFRFLRGEFSPIAPIWRDLGLDVLITPIQLLALLRVWMWCRERRPAPAPAAVLAALTTLLVYQVGFPQYQMVLFALVTYWVIRPEGSPLAGDPWLTAALAGYFGWLAAFDAYYCAYGLSVYLPGRGYRDVEDLVGLPTFILGSLLLYRVVRAAGRGDNADR
jgi:hypothetical protein